MTRPEHLRCPRCGLQRRWCICAEVPTLPTRLRFLVIRHWKDGRRGSNTARLAALALPGCEVVDHAPGEPLPPAVAARLAEPDTWLLFPPKPLPGSPPGSPGPPAPPPPEPPRTVVLVDGTWRQARRMARRVEGVRDLPRFVLQPSPRTVERLRDPPAPWAMATVEAIARTLEHYGEAEAAAALDALFAEFVRRGRLQRGLPVRPAPE